MTIVNLSSATATSGGWTKTRIFTSHLHTSRWFMVFASLLIMSVNGATYMFGLYSGDIKSSLGYDQTTLNLIGFFKDLGGNIGLISGLINEVMLSTILCLLYTHNIVKGFLWPLCGAFCQATYILCSCVFCVCLIFYLLLYCVIETTILHITSHHRGWFSLLALP
ncbi:hypothetical protein ACSBR1_002875 [Camellia fascicularis]